MGNIARVDESTRQSVWARGTVVPGYDPSVWRRDLHGRMMKYEEFRTQGKYAWDIEEIVPTLLGGSSGPGNFRPIHIERGALASKHFVG